MYLICGEALFDFFAQADSSATANKVEFKAIAGGSPFNVAVGLQRLGIDTALFAGLSTDYLGQRLKQVLLDEGISSRYLLEMAAPPLAYHWGPCSVYGSAACFLACRLPCI